jgi:thiol-disulfide isomerase/thioredoxin
MEDKKLVELIIEEDEQEEFGIQAISLVQFPAFEEDANFVFFNKNHNLTFAKIDEDKRLLVGCALVPDKKIPRLDQDTGEEYDVYFSKETIKKASELFLKHNKQNEHTLEHQEEIDGLSVVESWIVDDKKHDKSRIYGFSVPVGSWMVSIKVNNDDIWKQVKEKSIKGFSIEGFFVDKVIDMQTINLECKDCPKIDSKTFGKIKNLILDNELMPVAILDGEPLFETKEEAEMYATLFKGCRGYHLHIIDENKLYMACESHADAIGDNYSEDDFGKKKKKYKKKNIYAEQILYAKKQALAKYPWEQCIREQKKQYGSEETAKKICGYIKSRY